MLRNIMNARPVVGRSHTGEDNAMALFLRLVLTQNGLANPDFLGDTCHKRGLAMYHGVCHSLYGICQSGRDRKLDKW